MRSNRIAFLILCCSIFWWGSVGDSLRGQENGSTFDPPVTETVIATDQPAAPVANSSVGKAKNVILMIGDGMGPQQLELLFAYTNYSKQSQQASAIEELADCGEVGIVRTEPHGAIVVDSAAAATQLATGAWAGSEMVGVDFRGNSVPTVLEIARDKGKSTGLVSDTRMTHATPAGFAAHQKHRFMENEIAVDMLASRCDVLLSGGLRHWVPQAVNDRDSATYLAMVQMIGGAFDPVSKREDNRNLLLEARGDYQLVFDRTALGRVESSRVLGLFANSEMIDAIGEQNAVAAGVRTEPTLVEMSEKALELLAKNPAGFFLMIEGGQIDWAGHNNDAGDMLQELIQFDESVRLVSEWASKRDDTLVLVTADHETGGFGFSYSGRELPKARPLQGAVFRGEKFHPVFNYAPHRVLNRLTRQRKSFYQIFTEFDALPVKEQTAEKLQVLVNEAVKPLRISLKDATDLLTRVPNRNYRKGHPYLGTKTVPQIPDQEEFYVYGENLRMNRLGHILGAQQHVVWATGTHTSTPVAVISAGPGSSRFSGMMHATDLGKRMIEIVEGK